MTKRQWINLGNFTWNYDVLYKITGHAILRKHQRTYDILNSCAICTLEANINLDIISQTNFNVEH